MSTASRVHRPHLLLLSLGLTCVVGLDLQSQNVIQLRQATDCSRCRVEARLFTTLSDSLFAIDGSRTRVFRIQDGRFAVTGEQGTSIGLFSPAGRFERRVGRAGGALGEYGEIAWLTEGHDGLTHVLDYRSRRRTVYDAAFRTATTSFPMPSVNEALFLPDGRMLASGSIATTAATGLPLHIIGGDGAIERSFGSDSLAFRRGSASLALYRFLVPAKDGDFWIAPMLNYSVQHWSRELRLISTLRRSVDWFPPRDPDEPFGHPDRDRPPTTMRGIWVDPSGLLWANIGVPSRDWKPRQLATNAPVGEGRSVTQLESSKLFDTMVEVIDPRSQTVLASTRFRGMMGPISRSRLQWIMREGLDGGITIDVVELLFIRP